MSLTFPINGPKHFTKDINDFGMVYKVVKFQI